MTHPKLLRDIAEGWGETTVTLKESQSTTARKRQKKIANT